jgi:hypothetical protein
MEILIFEVTGQVIESVSRQPLANLKVEAWDKDVKYNDLLGQAFTNANGNFSITFDSTYFREHAPDPKPDLLFKVFLGRRPLKIIDDAVIYNAGLKTDVTLRVEIPEMRTRENDRVTPARTLEMAAFIQQSDFMGLYGQFREKAGSSLNYLSDMLVNTVAKMDLTPIKVGETRTENIVGKNVDSARGNLEKENIAVNEVRTYDPRLNKRSFSEMASFPTTLKPGQKVNLYEENGVVRYYSIEKEVQPAPGMVVEKDTTISKLKEELEVTRREAAEKDARISNLQKEMESLRKDQVEIKTLLQSDAMVKMMKSIKRPPTGTGKRGQPEK